MFSDPEWCDIMTVEEEENAIVPGGHPSSGSLGNYYVAEQNPSFHSHSNPTHSYFVLDLALVETIQSTE
jgi:hypothetical protein